MPERIVHRRATLEPMSAPQLSPTVTEVMRFEDLPLGARGAPRDRALERRLRGRSAPWYADLCRRPHKSRYADSRVMPTRAWKDRLLRGAGSSGLLSA